MAQEKTKIKICGITRKEDIAVLNRLCPDYIGFVFAGTKRKITVEMAAALRAALRREILSVGVFVREPIEKIVSICRAGILDLVQLHGDEPEDYIAEVKNRTKKPVIRAVCMRSGENILAKIETCADYLLFDAYQEGEYGGSGECFCWEELEMAVKACLQRGKNFPVFFLAGGLNAQNAGKAIHLLHPYALDVSSGVETDGIKDSIKMEEFVNYVRK